MKVQVMAVRSALTIALLAMGTIAQAATYHITLLKPSVVAGKELKPGDYKIEVDNDKAVISHGKTSIEAKVKTEATEKKYDSTTVRYEMDGEKYKVQEIGIGGTKTKLVITDNGSQAGL
jgi:hypothetical protein